MPALHLLGILVGLTAEARLAAPLGGVIEAGGGTARGAEAAVERLLASGVRTLISFGLAGGLDPVLRPGTVVIPEAVITSGMERIPTDFALSSALGGPTAAAIMAGDGIVATVREKRRLRASTEAAAIDLESGAVARAAVRRGLPFAVLRVVCDPAERDLPPAAVAALDRNGGIRVLGVLRSLAREPRQIPALLALASDAALARRALIARVAAIGQISIST